MRNQTIIVGALALALALAGCTPSSGQATLPPLATGTSLPGGTATSIGEPTALSTPTLASTAVTSPTVTVETATPMLATPTATPTATQQLEQIEIDAAGQLSPAVISATVGVTLELMLVNRSPADAVLMLDVTPAGTLSLPLPAATISDTTPIALTPTPEPTGTTVLSGTPTLEPTGTAIITGTATPTPAPGSAGVRTLWLRIDQPGSYTLRCIPAEPGALPACAGTVTITVAPAGSPTPTATPLATATLAPTGTTVVSGTATLAPTGTAASTVTATP